MGLGVAIAYAMILGAGVYWWVVKKRPIGMLYSIAFGFVPWVALSGSTDEVVSGIVAPLAAWLGSGIVFFVGYRKQAAGTKVCPTCAENVKDAASVCKHCGHGFSGPAPAPGA